MEPTNTEGAAAPKPRAGSKSNGRAWTAMLLGFAAVFAAGVTLFGLHSTARHAQLESHYDRTAARIASQVGLRWENIAERLRPLVNPANAEFELESKVDDDRAVELVRCDGPPQSNVYLSADRSGLVKRVERPSGPLCGRALFSTLLSGPRAGFYENKIRTRRFDQELLIDGSGTVLAASKRSPQLTTNAVPTGDKPLKDTTTTLTMKLGSITYRAFIHPISIKRAQSDPVPSLFVCGLIEQQALLEDGRRVESSYALSGLFLLAMAVICLPAAKLWLIGPRVRYRWSDVLLFKVATIAGAVLCLVLLFALLARESQRIALEGQLESVADDLQTELSVRIETTAAWLRAYNESPGLPLGTLDPNVPGGSEVAKDKLPCDLASWPGDRPIPFAWNVLFRLDAKGRQTFKYYSVDKTPCVEVSEREYFKAVHGNTLRKLSRATSDRSDLRGAAEVIRSRTTGEVALMIAMPDHSRPEQTVALEVPLEPMLRQVLPLGVHTAVLDARGRVMLHSDNSAFQEQSFFEDVDADELPTLRSAIDARLAAPLTFEYLSAPSRAFIKPLQGGWTVIAIASDELLDVPVRHTILLTVVFCISVLALMLLTFALRALVAPVLGGPLRRLTTLAWTVLGRSAQWLGARWPSWFARVSADASVARAPSPVTRPMEHERESLYGVPSSYTRAYTALRSPYEPAPRVQLGPACADGPSVEPSAEVHASGPPSWSVPASGTWKLGAVCALAMLLASGAFVEAYRWVAGQRVRVQQNHVAQLYLRHPECVSDSPRCLALGVQRNAPSVGEHAPEPPVLERVTAALIELVSPLPSPDAETTSQLYRALPDNSELPWTWSRHGAELFLRSFDPPIELRSQVPQLRDGVAADVRCLLFALAILGGLALILLSLRASFRRLDFTRAKAAPSEDVSVDRLRDLDEPRVLVFHPQPDLAGKLRSAGFVALERGTPHGPGPAFVEHAERFFERPGKLVSWIEKYPGKLIVLSAIDWTRWLPPEGRETLDRSFASFVVLRGQGVVWPPPELYMKRRALASELWASCNKEEQRLLAQLAIDGYVAPHPDNEPMVAHLRARGIVCSDRLAIAELHFRRYVRHTVSAHELRNPASSEQHDAWNAIRVPLSTAVALVLCFVSLMQPELAAVGLPVSSVLTAARPVLKVLGLVAAE